MKFWKWPKPSDASKAVAVLRVFLARILDEGWTTSQDSDQIQRLKAV